MDQRKILLQFVALDAAELRAEALCHVARYGLQFRRPHVIGRRVDKVAGEECGVRYPGKFGGVDAVRRHQPDIGIVGLAVAAEAIAAERKGKRGKSCIVRRIREAIGACRQQSRQAARAKRIARFRGLFLEAEQHLRDRTVGRGQDQVLAGLCA